MSTRFRPEVESLDAREVPAVFGNPWAGSNLTLSFAPDGTDVNGAPSDLSHLFADIPLDLWQGEILRAFQTWAVNANVNIGLVPDGGQSLGAPGSPQGDARFGDIRIAAVPLAPDALALGTPFEVAAGTRSGDVLWNSSVLFGTGGAPGADLFSAALHEAGHVFGIGPSTDPTSVMFQTIQPRTGLSAADVSAMTALYGARTPDAFDLAKRNETLATASNVRITSGKDSSTGGMWTADITTAGDVDVYNFRAEELVGGNLTAAVRVSGYSLLAAKLEILDASGRVIASGTAPQPGADVVLNLTGLTPGGTYYARVTGARGDVFGIGGYKLELRSPTVPATAPKTQVLNAEPRANDTLATASQLGQEFQAATPRQAGYLVNASLDTATDVDFYRVRTPQTANNAPVTMTVTVSTTPPGGTDPVVDVYDTHGIRMDALVLVHDGGTFTVQVLNAIPNVDYYVAVRHAHPGAGALPGNYTLNIDFGTAPVTSAEIASGTLAATDPVSFSVLNVNQAQVLHLVLDLSPSAASATAGARVTVVDATGAVMFSQFVLAGDTVSTNLFLRPGTYGVLVGVGTLDGSALTGLRFALRTLTLSDPIGPQPVSVTTLPAGVPAPAPAPIPPDPSALPAPASTPIPAPMPLPPLTYYSPVLPVAPTGPTWWLPPPTDWTQTNFGLLSGLLLPPVP